MKRIRWLGAQVSEFLRTIASKMKANPFTQNSYDGFMIKRVRDTFIEASYIQKLSYADTLVDPFGNKEIFNRIEYRQVEFNLFSDFPNIELLDAPRSINPFIAKLLELSNFSISIINPQVNLIDWAEAFQALIEKNISINSIQISGVEIDKGVSAKILLKGDKDVRASLDNFIKERQYILDKIQLKVKLNRNFINIQLANNASAKMPEDTMEYFLPLLRTSLANSKK